MIFITIGGANMGVRVGTGYLGSPSIQTSVANQEIIPASPANWNIPYSLYKFSLINYSDCTLLLNDKTQLFLKAYQGFSSCETDAPIYSVKFLEDGIRHNWIGAY